MMLDHLMVLQITKVTMVFRSAEKGTADETGSGHPPKSLLIQCLVQFTCEPALESVPGGVAVAAGRRGKGRASLPA
jgi:hypothetical protein